MRQPAQKKMAWIDLKMIRDKNLIKLKKIIIAGVDEVGRGCLAGPVVSAAVILKDGINLDLLKDSKKISFKKRQKFQIILNLILLCHRFSVCR